MKRRSFIKIVGLVLTFAATSHASAKSIYRNIRYGTITKELYFSPYGDIPLFVHTPIFQPPPPCYFNMLIPNDFKSLLSAKIHSIATKRFINQRWWAWDEIDVGESLNQITAGDYVGYTFNSNDDIRVAGLAFKYEAWNFDNGRT